MGQTNWTSLGMPGGQFTDAFYSPLHVVKNADGRLEVFLASSADGTLWHISQTTPGKAWGSWASIGSPPTTKVTALGSGTNADGRIEIFMIGSDQNLWHIWQQSPGGSWSTWFSSGKPSASVGLVGDLDVLCVQSNPDGRMEAFALGSDYALWHIWKLTPNSTWSTWTSLGTPLNTSCNLLGSGTNADGRIEVFTVGNDGTLWHIWQIAPGGSWSNWKPFENSFFGGNPIVGRNADGRLEVFLLDSFYTLWHIWQQTTGGTWSSWNSLGPISQQLPPASLYLMDICVVQNKDGHLEVLSTASDGALWHILQQTPGGSWGGWQSLGTPQGAALYSDPYVIANADGRLEVFAKGNPSDSTNFVGTAIWHTWQVTPGGEWGS